MPIILLRLLNAIYIVQCTAYRCDKKSHYFDGSLNIASEFDEERLTFDITFSASM